MARFPFMTRLPGWFVNGVATVGGVGNIKFAPGTFGSLVGTAFYALVASRLGFLPSIGLITVLFLVGWVFCDDSERRMGKTDPGCIVWDEFAAMPLVFLGVTPPDGRLGFAILLAAGFALFRFFDILKPLGIAKLQRRPGGLGIMVDDTAAAIASCAILHAGFVVMGLAA